MIPFFLSKEGDSVDPGTHLTNFNCNICITCASKVV